MTLLKPHWSRPHSEAVGRLLSLNPDIVGITAVAARENNLEIGYIVEHPVYGWLEGSLTMREGQIGTDKLFDRAVST